mmetsp:Transcript_19254/g.26950  ORF Transcript_19254/g.26950 Transcript_19254/m.26950 type:complete len:192 (-) Transcript_19254:63-638(-)
MASRGASETQKLRENLEEQLNRLLTQLQDLEENKEDLGEDYTSMRNDTLQQMKEFQASLTKMMQGNMTLVDEFGSVQLAIQAAVSHAFQTPEVIKMFAKKDRNSLRTHLVNLQTNARLGKISKETYTQQAVEILTALKKLGEGLTADEEQFLSANSSKAMKDFEAVANDIGEGTKNKILNSAATQIKKAQQ